MGVYGVIYCITCLLNGMKYVGQTTQPLGRRIDQHKRGDQYIDHAIRKYGLENFKVEVLEKCTSREQLNEREIFWIAELKCMSPNGYNLREGGAEYWHHEAETRAKQSVARKGKKRPAEVVARYSAAQRAYSSFKNLLAEIKNRQLSYKSLGKILGFTRSTFASKMRCKIKFTEKEIAKLVEIFGKPAEYLMKRDDGLSLSATLTKRGKTPFKNLANEMAERQFSYTALAKLMGESLRKISRKMHGDRNFTVKEVAKLVEIFGKPADYLLERVDNIVVKPVACRGETIFKNLLKEINERQLSYCKLAPLMNLTPPNISLKMRGERNFTAKDIAKLVELFGKPADYLMKRDE